MKPEDAYRYPTEHPVQRRVREWNLEPLIAGWCAYDTAIWDVIRSAPKMQRDTELTDPAVQQAPMLMGLLMTALTSSLDFAAVLATGGMLPLTAIFSGDREESNPLIAARVAIDALLAMQDQGLLVALGMEQSRLASLVLMDTEAGASDGGQG